MAATNAQVGFVDLSGARQGLKDEVNKKVKPQEGESPEAAEERRVTLLQALMSMLRRLVNRLSTLLGLRPLEPEELKRDQERKAAAEQVERMSFSADMAPREMDAALGALRKQVDAFVEGVKSNQLGLRPEDLSSIEALSARLEDYAQVRKTLSVGAEKLSASILPEVEALRANFPHATTEAMERMILAGDQAVLKSLLGDKQDLVRLLKARESAREMAWAMCEHAQSLVAIFEERGAQSSQVETLRKYLAVNFNYTGEKPYSMRPNTSNHTASSAKATDQPAEAAVSRSPNAAVPARKFGSGGTAWKDRTSSAAPGKTTNIAWLRPTSAGTSAQQKVAQDTNLCDKSDMDIGLDDDLAGEEGTKPAVVFRPSWAGQAASAAPQEEPTPQDLDRPKGG